MYQIDWTATGVLVALGLSGLSLYFLWRKDKFDERIVLAKYIEKIKRAYSKGINLSNEILAYIDKHGKSSEEGNKFKLDIIKVRDMCEEVYKKIGQHNAKGTPNPVRISALIVQIDDVINKIEQLKTDIKSNRIT